MEHSPNALSAHFAQLFAGRTDAYGDGGEHGRAIHRPIEHHIYNNHLFSLRAPIGIYPMLNDLTVRWGCSDFDTGYDQSSIEATNVKNVLTQLGVDSYVERSRSKGHHVWVFVNEWVPAQNMRDMLLFAHQIADLPVKEINPKQTTIEHLQRGFGNYVRLPYPGALHPNAIHPFKQCMVTDTGEPIALGTFLGTVRCNTPADIAHVAQLWQPPTPKPRAPTGNEYHGDLEPLRQKLTGLANRIWLDGPLNARDGLPGRDRSGTLSRLAVLCANDGVLSAAETLALVRDADTRWGKFSERGDCDEQLQRIIDWAWSQQ